MKLMLLLCAALAASGCGTLTGGAAGDSQLATVLAIAKELKGN